MESQRTVHIVNATGLHARPCHAVVSAALEFDSELRIRSGSREVNGKSILELMTLEASMGTDLVLIAQGADAEALLARLESLFARGFEESL